jgi:hypothetical protein
MVKRILFATLVLQAFLFTAKAQLGYNYAQFGVGAGVSYNRAFTDVPYQKYYPAFQFNLTYNHTPYTSFTFEYQIGKLSGGYQDFLNSSNLSTDVATTGYLLAVDKYQRSYLNNYKSFLVYADVQLGEFTDFGYDSWFLNAAKSIYIGGGVGLINNNIDSLNINRISPVGAFNPGETYYYGGENQSQNFMVPLRVGYQFKIFNNYDEPSLLINIGYQMNYVFGYGVDGYADPKLVTKTFEKYGGVQIGVKYNFGKVISYRKAIH